MKRCLHTVDPTGKLQEDEIYFNTWSTPFADSPNIRNPYLLLGDCLVSTDDIIYESLLVPR